MILIKLMMFSIKRKMNNNSRNPAIARDLQIQSPPQLMSGARRSQKMKRHQLERFLLLCLLEL